MTLRICAIIDTGIVGGPGKGLFQLLEHLPKNRATITVFNFDRGEERSREFIDVARSKGVDLVLLRQRFKLDPAFMKDLSELVVDRRFDLIQTHGYKSNVIGLGLRRKTGLPWLCVMHGWTNEGLRMRLNNALDRYLLRKADGAIAVSPPLFEVATKLRRGRNCSLVLNAIELPDISLPPFPTAEHATLSLGVFGRMSPEKGHALLLDALAQARSELPECKLLLAGDGQERESLQRQCSRLGLNDIVEFLGYQKDMKSLYKQIDMLLIPSLSEGLPNVALEAMAYSKPVLATRVGALEEVITDNVTGWLVQPGSASDLAKKLVEVTGRRSQLTAAGMQARASLHPKFSPQSRAEKFFKIYSDMTVGDRPGEF